MLIGRFCREMPGVVLVYLFPLIKILIFIIYIIGKADPKLLKDEKNKFCAGLNCEGVPKTNVCGIREEGEGVVLRMFQNECELLKYGCEVADESATYGLLKTEYCKQAFKTHDNETIKGYETTVNRCVEHHCSQSFNLRQVCGLRKYGAGFIVRFFTDKCQLSKHNCLHNVEFIETDLYICNGTQQTTEKNENETELNTIFNDSDKDVFSIKRMDKIKNLVIVDGSMLNFDTNITNINETVDNFFAATHVFDLPLAEFDKNTFNETTRRMLLKIAGPINVYKPWVTIPKIIKEDREHLPTLSTCYHKCPKKCPQTYAPVCGNPGAMLAREPSLMFQNHCFMDVAQCKMYFENKSSTAMTSAYIESSFMFCLGDQLNGLYRFLPLIRTLQHMGRLKKKGRFRYKLRNMRFFNNYMPREPKLMG